MTKKEFIELLQRDHSIPDNARVQIFNSELSTLEDVTGVEHDEDENIMELQTEV